MGLPECNALYYLSVFFCGLLDWMDGVCCMGFFSYVFHFCGMGTLFMP